MYIFNILEILFNISSRTAKRIVVWFCMIVILTSAHYFPQQYKKTADAVVSYYVELKMKEAQVWADKFTESFQKKDIPENVR